MNFIKQQKSENETRFSKEEINELKTHFKKASQRQKILVENARGVQVERTVQVMRKE